jgi:glyoxylase-like metal-dependent hydrolase (beta-lactamase superfamily II)
MQVVDQLSLGPLGTNCYLVRESAAADTAVVVDPSGEADEIQLELDRRNTRCVAILVTHGHYDHIHGVADLAERTGAPVHMPEGERALLENPDAFTPQGFDVRPHRPEVLLTGDETLELAGVAFQVLPVPGHSPAHLAYAIDGGLLSGDVLFRNSVGRTDIPGADWPTLIASIARLFERYPADTVVYPGHGEITTLGEELAENPFLEVLRAAGR